MYADRRGSFQSSEEASTCPSLTTSFDTKLDFDDMTIRTTATPTSTPRRCGSGASFVMGHDLNGFHDQEMFFYMPDVKPHRDSASLHMSHYNSYSNSAYDSFGSHHGLPNQPPSLESDIYSPSTFGTSTMASSPVTTGHYVIPSQTTFVDNFDLLSPARRMRPLQFNSPASEYASDCLLESSPTTNLHFGSEYSLGNWTGSSSNSTTPSRSSALRQSLMEPLQSTAALHRIQSESSSRPRGRRPKSNSLMGNNIRVQKQAKKECSWPDCNGRFQRQEHLKRHEKTHTNSESFPCRFCGKNFGRSDNLKSHIKLHADPNKKSSRTVYFAEASQVYEEMNRKPRKREQINCEVRIYDESPSPVRPSRGAHGYRYKNESCPASE